MEKRVRVAVSLPADILAAAEEARRKKGQSRSDFFRSAVEQLIHVKPDQKAILQYVEGYRRCPESANEVAEVSGLSGAALSQEPW